MDRPPINTAAIVGARLALVDLERRLPDMAEAELRGAYEAAIAGSIEAALYTGEMERRNLDD